MIYFCADDYGVSKTCNDRIEKCLKHGALNKVSVLPNGEITDFKNRLSSNCERLSLHINLVEGTPLSDVNDIPLLVSEQGYFKYSFVGLFFLSMSRKRKELEKQLYKEIRAQILFWIEMMGERVPISIDGHQHTHMIPLIFKTIMKVIKDQKIPVEYVRIPNEPIMPYVFTPSLYFTYSLTGLIKQWLLKFLTLLNQNELKNAQIDFSYFIGVMFSGQVTEEKIKKILPRYLKLANKHGKDIEIALHPGYLEKGEHLIEGCQKSFEKFYFSKWRKIEYEALLNFKHN